MRMKTVLISTIFLTGVSLLMSGCFTLSVYPLYDKESLVRNDDLAGLWGDPESPDSESWEFTLQDDWSYELVIHQNNSQEVQPEYDGIFTAHVLELDGKFYLDLFPDEPTLASDFYKCHVVPAHSFWRVEVQDNSISLVVLDTSVFEEMLEEGEIEISFVERKDVFVLTDTTAKLQDMITVYGDRLFLDSETMFRLPMDSDD